MRELILAIGLAITFIGVTGIITSVQEHWKNELIFAILLTIIGILLTVLAWKF